MQEAETIVAWHAAVKRWWKACGDCGTDTALLLLPLQLQPTAAAAAAAVGVRPAQLLLLHWLLLLLPQL
jgi:hypothetical protein